MPEVVIRSPGRPDVVRAWASACSWFDATFVDGAARLERVRNSGSPTARVVLVERAPPGQWRLASFSSDGQDVLTAHLDPLSALEASLLADSLSDARSAAADGQDRAAAPFTRPEAAPAPHGSPLPLLAAHLAAAGDAATQTLALGSLRGRADLGELLGSVLDAVPVPVVVWSEDGRVLAFNAEMRRRTPASFWSRIVGMSREAFALGVSATRHDELVFAEGGALYEVDVEGARRFLKTLTVPVDLDEGRVILVAYFDVTGSVERERSFRRAERHRYAFTTKQTLAHDLGNVVTVLASVLSIVVDGAYEERVEAAEDIEAMLALCRSMLDHLRGTGAMDGVPVDVRIREVLARVVRMAARPGIEFSLECPESAQVRCVAAEFERALINAITNACEALEPTVARGETGHVDVRVDVLAASRVVVLDVEDDGPGLPPAILDRGAPGTQHSTKGEGRGLGLRQIADFVAGADGVLSIDSPPEGGTILRMRLPLPTEPAAEPERVREQRSMRGEGVYLVEDHPSVRRALADRLRSRGHDVREFDSAIQARFALETGELPALLITDLQMVGRFDGAALVRWSREHHPHLPIVVVSAFPDSLALPGIMVLTKPVSDEALQQVLDQLEAP